MLNGTGDSQGKIELWGNRFPGLPDLAGIGKNPAVHKGAAGRQHPAQFFRQLFSKGDVFTAAD